MADIRHRVGITAPAGRVYHALATTDGLSGWWTRDVKGVSPTARAQGGAGGRHGHALPRGHEDQQLGLTAVDEVFRALADPSRRRLLDSLNGRNGQSLRELCAGLDMARQSVSKHLAILEHANLVTTVRRGREKFHYLNVTPINEIAERWINHYDQQRVAALSDLKRALEAPVMDKPDFVYTTYIKTTPERLWQGLTDPAFTRRYWGVAWDTDWKTGSVMTLEIAKDGVTVADPEQVVLESDPYRRLSYAWHTFTPEWAAAYDISDEDLGRFASERRSKVTFDLEPLGEMVKLTVIHDGFDAGSAILPGITEGWPRILSDLKTLLETGDTLVPA